MEMGSSTSRARLKQQGGSSQTGRRSTDYATSETSDISAGPEKWRRVRRGAHVSYQPFDVEDYIEASEDNDSSAVPFPPPSETSDDRKNWPKNCPFLHMKFDEFAIEEKQRFIEVSYHFWYFLTLTLLFNLCSAIITSLISPTPKEDTVYFAFVLAFIGFWWFFFGYFRLLYFAMRYRKSGLYVIYQLQSITLFFVACYMIFSAMGNMTQLLSPLAVGSAVPVRQNPTVGAIALGIAAALWMVVMLFCFFFIRKAHYFKNLPLSVERDIYMKERRLSMAQPRTAKISTMITDLFQPKLDKPHPPTKCGMLQGKDLWLQGMITLETVYVEYRADVHVFDHLVHERFHYQDVLAIKKTGKSNITFHLVHPTKRQLDDLEMDFDFSDVKVRDEVYKAGTKLWRRVGRNTDMLARKRAEKLMKMRRLGRGTDFDDDEPDFVEAFSRARRMETRERLNDHMVTYKDWQKILDCVKIHVLTEGQNLVDTGEDFSRLYHVAQGRIEVNEVLEMSGPASFQDGSDMMNGSGMSKPMDAREMQSYAKALAKRQPSGGLTKANLEEKLESEPLEYEDPEADGVAVPEEDSGSSEEEESEPDEKTDLEASDHDSEFSSDIYSLTLNETGPEMVMLGTLRKDDIFGVVPFLLAKEGTIPKSGLTFTAKDPISVVFSIDTVALKADILKPKKDITAAFHKYLAVILGERTEAAEDAMFTRKVQEKRLEAAREEERMLEQERQFQEELGPGADKGAVKASRASVDATSKDQHVRNIFSFSASEKILKEFKGRYTYTLREEKKRQEEVRIKGMFYVTEHYFAFVGKKVVDISHRELNRHYRNVMRHDEVITIKRHPTSTKALIFTDIGQDRKMLELPGEVERERVYMECMSRWKSEDEVTSRQMRKMLRRKMTRLSLAHLNQAEMMTQQGIGQMMTDMTEREKKTLFAGSVPIGLNRNQVVIGELNFNDNLYLLCTGIVRVQRVKEHASNVLDSGKAMDRVVFQEIHSGEIFGFDSFLTGSPAYSSVVVDSEKAVVRSCTKDQIVARLREDRKLAAKFYRIAAVSIASRLAEISPLDIYL